MIKSHKNNLPNKPPLFGGIITKLINQNQKIAPSGMRFLEGEIISKVDEFFVDSAKFLNLKLPTNNQHIQIDCGEITYKNFEIKSVRFKGNCLAGGSWNDHPLVREFDVGEPFLFQTLEDFQELSPESALIEYLCVYRIREGIVLNWNINTENSTTLLTSKKYNRYIIEIIEDESIGKVKYTPTNKMLANHIEVSENKRVPVENLSYDLFGKYDSVTSNSELGIVNFTFDKNKIASKIIEILVKRSDYNPQSLIDAMKKYEIDEDDEVLSKIRKGLIQEEVEDILSNSYSSIKGIMEQYLSITPDVLISALFLSLHGTYNDEIAREIVNDIRNQINEMLDKNWKLVQGYTKGIKRKKAPKKNTKLQKQAEELKTLSRYKEIRSNLKDLLTDEVNLIYKEGLTIKLLADRMSVNEKTISNRLKKMEHLIDIDKGKSVNQSKSSKPQTANIIFKAIKEDVYKEIMNENY